MNSPTARPLLNDLAPLDDLRQSGAGVVDDSVPHGSPLFSRLRCQLSSDEELVVKLKNGETEALTVLFERYSTLVFRIARRILRDDAEAEDAVQQVFLDSYRSLAKFDPAKGNFKVWLTMYAYHRALNHKRGLASARFYELEDLEEVLQNPSAVEKKRPFPFQATEAAHLVRETLEQIEPRQREVIELVYYEGCTAEEIARRTGDSANVVRHNLYRGMEKARSVLNRAIGRKNQNDRDKA